MRALDALASLTPWLTLHLALRQLGRQSQDYIRPLLLVIISLAMGVYTLSMAASLDQWLVDRMYYGVGADLVFTPRPLVEGTEYVGGDWIPLPAEFRKVEGVTSATSVGDFPARLNLSTGDEMWGRFLAIDRVDFPSAAWFRCHCRSIFCQMAGALVARFYFRKRFRDMWLKYMMVVMAGFSCGMGITSMVAMSFNVISKMLSPTLW